MDAELKQHLESMELRIQGRMDDLESRLMIHTSEQCEKIETKLLTEFWKWGRTSDVRTRQAMENVNAVNERMLNAEDRISALERRRIEPPQAA